MYARECLELSGQAETAPCHVLPCSIKFNGMVDKTKFEVQRSPELSSWFRGRKLEGYEVDLEKYGYRGYTIIEEPESAKEYEEEPDQSFDDMPQMQGTKLIQTGKAFNSIVVWEHGKPPLKTDPWGRKLEELLEFSKYTS